MQRISGLVLRLFGWKITSCIPPEIKKAVIVMAPHTSYWDFVLGRIGYWYLGIPSKFYIKKEAFFWPLGIWLKKLGGMPVNRHRISHLVADTAKQIQESDTFFITITPEGTRALVRQWKRGYYQLAMKAEVPLILGYLDYKEKTGGPTKVFYPTGDYENDLKIIEDFYRGKQGRNPQWFNVK